MLLMKNILREGNKQLYKISSEVIFPLEKKEIKMIKEMNEFLKNSMNPEIQEKYKLRAGVGIAAPQIGILKRVFCVYYIDALGVKYEYNVINPVIIEKSRDLIYLETGEGCLSVDSETTGITPRYKSIRLTGFEYIIESNEYKPLDLKLDDYLSIVFQHEFDHLNGVLFTSKEFDNLPYAKPIKP
jgi:peptide deformylase